MSDDDDGTGLPASVEAAWGIRTRPAKGPKPALTLERIVGAAVRIAEVDGLGSVSMGKVASEVGVTAMALYRYVGSKDELLGLMVDAGIGAPPQPPPPGEDWRAELSGWAWGEAAAFRRHPWVLRIPAALPPLPNQVAWMDHGLRCLGRTRLSEDVKLSAMLLISNVVRVYVQVEQDLMALAPKPAGATGQADGPDGPNSPDRPDRPDGPDGTWAADAVVGTFSRIVAQLAPAERFPALSAALASGALDHGDPMDKELTFGLERALDGIAVLIAAAENPR
jgi:AcrR family transcriptional regulator